MGLLGCWHQVGQMGICLENESEWCKVTNYSTWLLGYPVIKFAFIICHWFMYSNLLPATGSLPWALGFQDSLLLFLVATARGRYRNVIGCCFEQRTLSLSAQQLYARLLSRKWPQWVSCDGLGSRRRGAYIIVYCVWCQQHKCRMMSYFSQELLPEVPGTGRGWSQSSCRWTRESCVTAICGCLAVARIFQKELQFTIVFGFIVQHLETFLCSFAPEDAGEWGPLLDDLKVAATVENSPWLLDSKSETAASLLQRPLSQHKCQEVGSINWIMGGAWHIDHIGQENHGNPGEASKIGACDSEVQLLSHGVRINIKARCCRTTMANSSWVPYPLRSSAAWDEEWVARVASRGAKAGW